MNLLKYIHPTLITSGLRMMSKATLYHFILHTSYYTHYYFQQVQFISTFILWPSQCFFCSRIKSERGTPKKGREREIAKPIVKQVVDHNRLFFLKIKNEKSSEKKIIQKEFFTDAIVYSDAAYFTSHRKSTYFFIPLLWR